MTVHYGFGNVGRGRDSADLNALKALRDALPDERAAVFLCEINEGDHNDELALAKRIFKGWRFYCQRSREPIALSPDWPRARSRVVWVPDSSVKRWSPQRSINVVHLPDENTTLIGAHPAAGAYHGDRPAAAKELLVKSWDKTFATHRLIETSLHERDRNVVWAVDYNRLDLPPIAAGEKTVFHDDTDWGRVLPAAGYEASFHYVGRVQFNVDSHDGHVFRGAFTEK